MRLVVEHGKSGKLFPVGNVDALTNILVTLYDSQDMRRALGAAARERVSRYFKFSEMLDHYKAFIPL